MKSPYVLLIVLSALVMAAGTPPVDYPTKGCTCGGPRFQIISHIASKEGIFLLDTQTGETWIFMQEIPVIGLRDKVPGWVGIYTYKFLPESSTTNATRTIPNLTDDLFKELTK